MLLKIGSRKSRLALIQASLVVEEIKKYHPGIDCEIVPIMTSGDLITDRNLYDIGGKALFLKELEIALSKHKIDIAVHSLKDVPGRLGDDFELAACLERGNACDVLISTKYKSISELPKAATVGTSSPRRKVMLKQHRPDLNIVTFRGNVDTRIKKLLNHEVDATVLACAGLVRLNTFNKEYCHLIPEVEILPAAGQGVIAIEVMKDNAKAKEICAKINHEKTWALIQGERAFLEYLDADCKTPLAAYAHYTNLALTQMNIEFMMADFEGSNIRFHKEAGLAVDSRAIGIRAAQVMLKSFSGLDRINRK